MKIKLFVACEIQYFQLGIFSFNSYVYYLTRGFIGFIEKLLFGVFLGRKIITILRKITINFRQVSLKGILLSVRVLEFRKNPLKAPVKKFLKNFTTNELLHKWLLRFPERFYLFTGLFVTYTQTYFVFVFIFVKNFSSRFYYS